MVGPRRPTHMDAGRYRANRRVALAYKGLLRNIFPRHPGLRHRPLFLRRPVTISRK
jgi:hypothetical protein